MKEMFYIKDEPAIVAETRRKVLTAFNELEFFEEGHIYRLHGKQIRSASGIGAQFESKPFDAEAQAIRYAERHGNTPEYWMKKWAENGEKASSAGTKVHEFGESYSYCLNGHPELIQESAREQFDAESGRVRPISPKEESAKKFHDELPSCYHLVLNETMVHSGLNPDESKNLTEPICGTFDMLYYYDGEGDASKAGFVIFDYKTNKDLFSEFNQRNNICLLPPFEEYIQEDRSLYAIQQSLYGLMLEDIGLNIIDRRLVWLREDGYQIVPVDDVSAQLREIL